MSGGLESRCVSRVYDADGAARHHTHRTHDLRSGSQDHHSSKNSVQKTICCNSTSSAPDDGRIRPKHVKLRIPQSINLLDQFGISHYFMMKMHGQTTLKKGKLNTNYYLKLYLVK